MREVDHFRQEIMCRGGNHHHFVSFISFLRQRLDSGDVVQDSGEVGQRSGGSGPPER
jgi:uncharacterized NAD(P)/FAD-binding protein YdhS